MNIESISSQQRMTEPPICFGKEWEAAAPECNGGPDPKWTNPKTGSHVREKCQYFYECGARKGASPAKETIIPAAQLIRPIPLPAPVAPPRPEVDLKEFLQRQQQLKSLADLQALSAQRSYAPQAPQQPAFVQHGQAPSPVNPYSVAPYLTTPEQRAPDGTVWGVLARETVRSMGKSVGHTIAHFFDIHRLK